MHISIQIAKYEQKHVKKEKINRIYYIVLMEELKNSLLIRYY